MRKLNLALVAAAIGLLGSVAQVAGLVRLTDLNGAANGSETETKCLASTGVVGFLLWHPKS